MSRTLEREVVQEQSDAEARVLAEAFAAMPDPYQFATDGTTAESAPTVERRIREALRELRDGDAGGVAEGDDHYVLYERSRMDLIVDLLGEALELEQTREAIATGNRLVATDDSAEIARIVNDLDEQPARVAVRVLALERQVQALTERSFLFPRPRGAAQ